MITRYAVIAAAISLLPAVAVAQTSATVASTSTTTRTSEVEKPVVRHVTHHRKYKAHRRAATHHVAVKTTASKDADGTVKTTTDVTTPR